jgi:hypothetical protein
VLDGSRLQLLSNWLQCESAIGEQVIAGAAVVATEGSSRLP